MTTIVKVMSTTSQVFAQETYTLCSAVAACQSRLEFTRLWMDSGAPSHYHAITLWHYHNGTTHILFYLIMVLCC